MQRVTWLLGVIFKWFWVSLYYTVVMWSERLVARVLPDGKLKDFLLRWR